MNGSNWEQNRRHSQGFTGEGISDNRRYQPPEHNLIDIMNMIGTKDLEFIGAVESFVRDSTITTNQLRNFYDIVVSLSPDDSEGSKKKLVKLRIMLEYAFNRKNVPPNFYNSMKLLLEDILKLHDKKRIDKFKLLMEAVVAYSRKEGK